MEKRTRQAIFVLDHLIEAHIKNSKGIRDMIKDWTSDSKGLGEGIASVHEDVVQCLLVVKNLIENKPNRRKLEHTKSN